MKDCKQNILKKRFTTSLYVFIIVVLIWSGAGVAAVSFAAAADGAEGPIDIYLNGVRLDSDVPPMLKNDRTFVPIRVIGEALGYEVDYLDGSQTVIMQHSASGATIEMVVGVPFATINGNTVDLPVPAFIESGRTLAPVRFLSEALGSKVEWYPGYDDVADKVVIYSPYPINVSGGKVQIASRYEDQYWEFNDEYFGKVMIGYDITIPVFTIPGKESFARELNDKFNSMMDGYINGVKKFHNELLSDDSVEAYGGFSEEFSYDIIGDDGRILAFQISGYSYYGGAHGMPLIFSYNLDLDKGMLLTYADIFKPGVDYEKILIQRILALRAASPDEYEDVNEPNFLEEGSFYFDGGYLVIYYHPSNLSFYARGFVEFRIPLASISDYILDEYK